ncbi:7-carboxy-7-deazaguanine synthase QueE [Oleiagrimonas sp. C23AA]|uniref:7-carboxy-7-deazaguanine synthase QueE n=1 Tax=Oleiagrimonas sp. C23AA TaxID=2719047 RepID=UPI0014225D54|nr:7-carboxy-7-deazaguanine synthase QueE [Oleiagrimonas sp. C23AA]NII09979.1 7-carboxy-7-deazaguanine synthase QueE [Oleiagrimonas sp. C23AA]
MSEPGSQPVSAPAASRPPRLRITEIFHSIQGEADAVGWPTVFVRLTGCPLRCVWCDTEYAFHGGDWRDIDDIVDEVIGYGAHHVCVSGGEPLAQKRCLLLLEKLCDQGLEVSLETSGALDVAEVDKRVRKVLDLKAPDSGESGRNLWSNLEHLTAHDQIKMVLAGREDFDWACRMLAEHELSSRCQVLLSPVHGKLAPRQLAEWILEQRLPVRMQMQLHKLLWGDVPGH